MRKSTKIWVVGAVSLTLIQALASALLAPGFKLTAISDFMLAIMLLALVVAFAQNAIPARGRLRVFWAMQSVGWFALLIDQFWWMLYDLVLQKPLPTIFAGDALLFTPGVMMLAGLLLKPHLEQSKRRARLGTLDFLLLMVWWVFFYVYLVTCWQYVVRNEALYNSNYDRLYTVEIVVVVAALCVLLKRAVNAWKRFYALYLGAVLFGYVSFSLENRAIEQNTYFNGSWYDTPYLAAFAIYLILALRGRKLELCRDSTEHQNYGSWLEGLTILAVLSLPVIVVAAVLERGMPLEIMHFRVLVTALAMFAMASLVFMKQKLLHVELKHANQVLEESSTTDPLTGIRNRRFFSATIERDVAQSLRAYAEGHDLSSRDLVFYLIDLDDFKRVNDRYGHDAGDRVLIEAARRIHSAIRNSDLLVRWGGEEFLVVSRDADRLLAENLAERVLDAFRSTPFSDGLAEPVRQTCSVGWAAFPWVQEDCEAINFEGVLKYADRALYRAKKAGKNQAIGMVPSRDGANPVGGAEALADSLESAQPTGSRSSNQVIELAN